MVVTSPVHKAGTDWREIYQKASQISAAAGVGDEIFDTTTDIG